jgi:hypothetical protein
VTETSQANTSRTYTDAQKATQLVKCWELRRDGYTEREISKATKLPLTTVHRRLVEAFEDYVSPERERVRAWEDDRLDLVVREAVKTAKTADDPEVRLRALDRILKASERRARMHGADEPDRSIVTTDSTFLIEQDRELVELLAGISAETEAKIKDLKENAAP